MFELGAQCDSGSTISPCPAAEAEAEAASESRSDAAAAKDGNTTFLFARGGFQGAEGVVEGEGWYIENVLEELDMEREWYVIFPPHSVDHIRSFSSKSLT